MTAVVIVGVIGLLTFGMFALIITMHYHAARFR
jgi:hypothetical protein